MLSQNPTEPLPQAPSSYNAEAGAAKAAVDYLDPEAPIEVAAGGNGTVNDPSASDRQPPPPAGY